jgi:hypothetical protein
MTASATTTPNTEARAVGHEFIAHFKPLIVAWMEARIAEGASHRAVHVAATVEMITMAAACHVGSVSLFVEMAETAATMFDQTEGAMVH